jgi:hypothetical protein
VFHIQYEVGAKRNASNSKLSHLNLSWQIGKRFKPDRNSKSDDEIEVINKTSAGKQSTCSKPTMAGTTMRKMALALWVARRRGHTAADTRQAGTRRANTHVVRLVGVHNQQVGSQVEAGMPRILPVAVDTHVEEGNLVVAGTGHIEMPHIRAAHGTRTGPYLDSAKSKQRERERKSQHRYTNC